MTTETLMDREDVMRDPRGMLLLMAQEEKYEEFVYRAKVKLGRDDDGVKHIISLEPWWPND